MKRSKVFNLLIRLIVVSVASIVMAMNINSFVHTGGLLPGGASGLTLLIQESMRQFLGIKLSYTLINLLINAIPVYIGFRFIGKKFTMLSCWVIVLTSVLTDMLPSVVVTEDIMLISIFGGLINGFGISLCLLADSTSGGTDFIAIYMSEKRGVDSFYIPLVINGFILVAAGVMFDWDKALYSIIFQFASTIVIRIMYRKYQKATLFIITNKPRAVCDVIHEISNHSATVIDGEGSYEHSERNVVYSVVNAAEVGKVVNKIKEKDKEAFVNVIKSERILGRFYQRPTD
ncbi:MAG: YitT family protein [Eubacterium sp.]|nr:YitT family protein [Eubacterium sp.]